MSHSRAHLDGVGERAQRRIEGWQSEPAFESAIGLEDRLAHEGISAEVFAAVLDEVGREASTRSEPSWWLELLAAYQEAERHGDRTPAVAGQSSVAGFLHLVRPVTQRARRRLRARLRQLSSDNSPWSDPGAVEEMLVEPLGQRLLWMVSRTLALELQVASLRGLLPGDSSGERFAMFTDRLRDPEVALRLFNEYPVLGREIVDVTGRWEQVSLELVHRLAEDWPAIVSIIFAGRSPGALVGIDGGAGDVHRGGRSVRILTFASGERLVYKPRSLAVDVHFQALLTFLNARGFEPALRMLRVIDRGLYGWSEFAVAPPAGSADAVKRFYTRLGAQLALLYVLEATDFHHENLIAAGEQPILVDLEALFQPRIGTPNIRQATDVAWRAIDRSVLRVGLLPQWQGDPAAPFDISGIGSVAGHITPYPVPQWEAEGTDAMKLVRRRMAMSGSANRPRMDGAEVDPLRFVPSIVDGFSQMYRFVARHRDALLADDGPIGRFAGDEVRVLLRATRTYAILARESFHPDVLRDALDRDRLLDRLWLVAQSCPELVPAVASERADLLRGDIPVFTTVPSSRDVLDSDGRLIGDICAEPAMTNVRERVAGLNESDLARQVWFIRASLSTLAEREGHSGPSTRGLPTRLFPATHQRLLDAASAVGRRLEALALRGERDVSWIGLAILAGEHCSLTPLGIDLYDGLPGIALFLAQLGAMTGETRYTDLARGAVESLQLQIPAARDTHTSVGAFDGWSGIAYALCHLGAIWNDVTLLKQAAEIAGGLAPMIDIDRECDLLSGSAGAIAVLLALHAFEPSDALLGMAIRAGDRVLATATEQTGGIGWYKDAPTEAALAGFSHGSAGIAWSLVRLAAASREDRFAIAAMRAIDFERALYSEAHRNWPDLRHELGSEHRFQTSWCHGAMGIGLARITTRELLDDAADSEIDVALRTTLAQGLSQSHALCHGSLGNVELILEAARRLDHDRWQPHLERISGKLLHDMHRYGWYCGTSQGIESPGLMTGLAGIGYGLLRLADPDRVPSILTLEPPAVGRTPAHEQRTPLRAR